jgi:hypothetical protein
MYEVNVAERSGTGLRSSTRGRFRTPMTGMRISFRTEMPFKMA